MQVRFFAFFICLLFLVNVQSVHAGLFNKKDNQDVQKHKKEFKKTQNREDYIHILNLNDQQTAFYKQIRHQEYEQIAPIVEQIKLKHDEMEVLLKSDVSFDELSVKKKVIKKELKDYIEKIHQIKIENEEKIEAILNDEQKANYKKLKEDYNNAPTKKTPPRSMGSVNHSQEFIFAPCESETKVPACKIDDLMKK